MTNPTKPKERVKSKKKLIKRLYDNKEEAVKILQEAIAFEEQGRKIKKQFIESMDGLKKKNRL